MQSNALINLLSLSLKDFVEMCYWYMYFEIIMKHSKLV